MVNKFLQRQGRNAQDIHGDLDQSQRQATLDAFKAGKVDFLVATDVAARGLDIIDLPAVINLDVPYHPDDYVHRIGRTGRAGKEGRAYTIADSDDAKYLAGIERLLGQKLNRKPIEGISGELIRPARPSRRKAVPAEAPAELAPVEAAGEATEPKPATRRRRRKAEPAEAATEVAAAETAAVAAAADAAQKAAEVLVEAPAADAAPKRRVRKPRAKAVAAEPALAEAAAPPPVTETEVPEAPPPADRGRERPVAAGRDRDRGRGTGERGGRGERKGQRDSDQGERAPVVGLGDHVPAFLLRPVPVKVSA
jgi:superfamily II DNA/RNA helicase